MPLYALNLIEEKTRRFILLKMCELKMLCIQDMLHSSPKYNGIWQSKWQRFLIRIQTNFTICHERSKDIEISLIFNLINTISNFISETWHERLCTLFDFSGYETPYDSNHVQHIKKERHLDWNILWMDTRSFIILSLISFLTHYFFG